MVVYEVKDTNPMLQPNKKGTRRREVDPVEPINRVKPIDFLTASRGWNQEKEESEKGERNSSPEESVQSAHTIIGLINDQLEMLGVAVHLALAEKGDGYCLNVHDCSDGEVCKKIAEEPIDLSELPELLDKLKQQSGILLDTQL